VVRVGQYLVLAIGKSPDPLVQVVEANRVMTRVAAGGLISAQDIWVEFSTPDQDDVAVQDVTFPKSPQLHET
jgi:hypothetical protein